jgi:hypothetical protein
MYPPILLFDNQHDVYSMGKNLKTHKQYRNNPRKLKLNW